MHPSIRDHRAELSALCRRHHVRRLELFGSATSDRDSIGDLDFLVEFEALDPDSHADAYFGLLENLEQLFGRSVDLVMTSAITNPYFLMEVAGKRTVVKAAALLYDMQQAGMLVERFTSGKLFDDYANDPLLCSAVERQLEIIGEALNQLDKIEPDKVASITDHRRIIALRNILVHGYAKVDHRVIWNIVERNLPILHREIDALMREP